jgi:hypothetical protein
LEKKHWAIFIVFVVIVLGFAVSNFFIDWFALLGISETTGPVIEMPAAFGEFEINILYIIGAVILGVIFISSFLVGIHEHNIKKLKEQRGKTVEKERLMLERRPHERRVVRKLEKEEKQELKSLTPIKETERFMTKKPRVPTYLKGWRLLRRPKKKKLSEKEKLIDVNEKINELLKEVKKS